MPFVIISFVAGMLTVLAPCILPLLPVVLGGAALSNARPDEAKISWLQPLVIVSSLAVSVIIFSLLLKASTSLLGVPSMVWQFISGVIIILFGLTLLFLEAWAAAINKTGLVGASNKLLGKGLQQKNLGGSVLMGAALGPIFNSCSPTYAIIFASVLPATFVTGLVYLVAYTLGLSLMLFAIAFFGQRLTRKLSTLSDPKSWLHKALAVLLILVGLAILFGLDKQAQIYILDKGWYDPISNFEERLDLQN